MNGVLEALASLALLAFTVKLAETAIVNNTAGGVSGAGGAGAKTRSAATPASNNFGAELSANNPPTAHRPGWTIKKALSKELPLHNGTSTDKASILDLYKTYQQLIKQENAQRYKQYRTHRYSLKGMTLSSFKSLFKFVKYLGLVRPVSVYGSSGKRITKIGVYGLYELTDKVRADNSSWDDLCGVWRNRK